MNIPHLIIEVCIQVCIQAPPPPNRMLIACLISNAGDEVGFERQRVLPGKSSAACELTDALLP